jgi:hypothetical protein
VALDFFATVSLPASPQNRASLSGSRTVNSAYMQACRCRSATRRIVLTGEIKTGSHTPHPRPPAPLVIIHMTAAAVNICTVSRATLTLHRTSTEEGRTKQRYSYCRQYETNMYGTETDRQSYLLTQSRTNLTPSRLTSSRAHTISLCYRAKNISGTAVHSHGLSWLAASSKRVEVARYI